MTIKFGWEKRINILQSRSLYKKGAKKSSTPPKGMHESLLCPPWPVHETSILPMTFTTDSNATHGMQGNFHDTNCMSGRFQFHWQWVWWDFSGPWLGLSCQWPCVWGGCPCQWPMVYVGRIPSSDHGVDAWHACHRAVACMWGIPVSNLQGTLRGVSISNRWHKSLVINTVPSDHEKGDDYKLALKQAWNNRLGEESWMITLSKVNIVMVDSYFLDAWISYCEPDKTDQMKLAMLKYFMMLYQCDAMTLSGMTV